MDNGEIGENVTEVTMALRLDNAIGGESGTMLKGLRDASTYFGFVFWIC